MTGVFVVIYCVCSVAFMTMCTTSVVYMIRDMIMDSHRDEQIDNDENVTDND